METETEIGRNTERRETTTAVRAGGQSDTDKDRGKEIQTKCTYMLVDLHVY